VRIFAFVDAQKTDFAIITLCRVCGVSTSGYYRWAERLAAGPSDVDRDDALVLEQIRAVHDASRGRYGQPRVTAQLARQGVVVNHKRVERLMALHGLVGRCGRKKVRTTVRDPAAVLAAEMIGHRTNPTGVGYTHRSMGTIGDSYDNAMVESFFASLKRELVDDEHFATRADARAAVFEWLIRYNTDRLHSALQYRPPVEYERHLINHQQQAA
jgi:transposase InsO family protein